MAIQWIIKSRACARALITGLLRYARNDKMVVCAGAQGINYLGPVVKPRDDKKGTRGPGRRMTRKERGARGAE